MSILDKHAILEKNATLLLIGSLLVVTVVLGNMWNGKDLPPVSQPANKFLSLFQTRSIAGTLNEILFDATKDQERLIFRSGNQYLQLSPQGITASSAITVPTSPTPKLQPAAPSELRIAPRSFPQKQ